MEEVHQTVNTATLFQGNCQCGNDDGNPSIPDLGDLAAYGKNEKAAVAHVAELAAEHVRTFVERGQPAPRARKAAEMPSVIRSREIGRSLIPVEVGRAAAKPGPPSNATH